MKKLQEKLTLLEDEEISIDVPEETTIEEVSQDTVTNAYSSAIKNIISTHWTLIDDINGLITTLQQDSVDFDKDSVINILSNLIDNSIINVGMITKVSELINNKESELMQDGIEKAEEVIDEPKKDESACKNKIKKVITEDYIDDWYNEVDKKIKEKSDAESIWSGYWLRYAWDELYNRWENSDEDEEIQSLCLLPVDETVELCEKIAEDLQNNEWMWEKIYDSAEEAMNYYLSDYLKLVVPNDEISPEDNKEE